MDRIWQWAWDRHATGYSWAVFVISYVLTVPLWVFTAIIIVEYEESDRHVECAAAAAAITLVLAWILVLPGTRMWRPVDRWAASDQIDRHQTLDSTYTLARS